MEYEESLDGSVPVVFCDRQKKWLPIEEHAKCEHCVAEVYDEAGEPVSFICLHSEERKEFQPGWVDRAEIGRGAPTGSEPDEADEPDEPEPE